MEAWNLFLQDMQDVGITEDQVYSVVTAITAIAVVVGLYYLWDAFAEKSRVVEIFIHPVKSLRGISVLEAELDEYGFKYDRQYMVAMPDTNKGGYKFVTQREQPRLVLIDTSLNPITGTLTLSYPRNKPVAKLEIPLALDDETKKTLPTVFAEIWKKPVESYDLSATYPEIKHFWNHVFEDKPELRDQITVVAPKAHRNVERNVTPRDVGGREPTSNFQDYFPGNLITTASLKDLHDRVYDKTNGVVDITARNFRPNLVISTTKPWDEDDWKKVRIGRVNFHVPCRNVRCRVTTVNIHKGEFETTHEPYKTMQSFRRIDEGCKYEPCFGMNLVHDRIGPIIRVGDELRVLKRGPHHYICI